VGAGAARSGPRGRLQEKVAVAFAGTRGTFMSFSLVGVDCRRGQADRHDRETGGEVVEATPQTGPAHGVDQVLPDVVEVLVLLLHVRVWARGAVEEAVVVGHQRVLVGVHK
jgi:hypothetical protein